MPSSDFEARPQMMDEEYLILQCPACERDVKVKADSAGVRMGCPYCREPLEIAESAAEGTPAESQRPRALPQQPLEPAPRQPLVFRQLGDDDIAEVSSLQFADEYRRRRLPTESPEWDDEAILQDRAAGRGGPATADASRISPLLGPGGKRLLTRSEHNFRIVKFFILGLALAVAAVIGYSALVRTWKVVGQDQKTRRELPDEIRQKIAEVLGQKEPISSFLTSAEETAAVAIVNGFLEAKSVDDRLPFVRQPERVEALMRDWYSSRETITDWPPGEVLRRDKRLDHGRYFIRLAIDFAGIGPRIFSIEQTHDALRLDWETAVGYQEMPLADFKAKRPTTPVPFRVKLKPGDYYNYQFDDRQRYFATELSYPGQSDFNLFGYIDREQPWAAALIHRLETGDAPSLIVELRYPDSEILDDRQVEIFSIISQSWWL